LTRGARGVVHRVRYSTENFEERTCEDGKIDREVVDYLKSL